MVVDQVLEPIFTDKLPVGGQIFNFMRAKYGHKLIDELNAFSGIRIAFFRQEYLENRHRGSLMDDRQDEKVDRKAAEHPVGAIHRQDKLIIGDQRGDQLSDHILLNFDFFKKSLNPSVMRIGLGLARKCVGKLSKINGFHFDQGDDETRETFDPSEIPAKMRFEGIDENGSMIHGGISYERKSLREDFGSFPR